MTQEAPTGVEQLISDYEDLLNGDFSKLDVLSESYTLHGPTAPEEGLDRDGLEELVRENLKGFPDGQFSVDEMLASEEVVMSDWTITGTHEGEFNGIPPTGREVEYKTMSKQRIENGKIQEEWGYLDPQEILSQLGVTDK